MDFAVWVVLLFVGPSAACLEELAGRDVDLLFHLLSCSIDVKNFFFFVDRLGGPQSQEVCVEGVISREGQISSLHANLLLGVPLRSWNDVCL